MTAERTAAMPTVESKITIAAPLDEVYTLARDIERFPEFMDDVEEVKILERTDERQISHWVGAVKEFKRTIQWTEEDFWNDDEYTCHFRQTEGDFSEYSGNWEFTESGDGTEVTLVVEYEYNIPLIGPLIKNLLHKKMQQNCDSMLTALKTEAEK
jgi:uncharacterized membrane protein